MAQPAPRGIMRFFCSGPGYEPRQRDFISNAKGASIDACYRPRMGSRSWHAKGEAERPPAYGFLPATRLPEQPYPSSSCSSARNEAGVPYDRHTANIGGPIQNDGPVRLGCLYAASNGRSRAPGNGVGVGSR